MTKAYTFFFQTNYYLREYDNHGISPMKIIVHDENHVSDSEKELFNEIISLTEQSFEDYEYLNCGRLFWTKVKNVLPMGVDPRVAKEEYSLYNLLFDPNLNEDVQAIP